VTEASAYVIEDIQGEMESAYKILSSFSRKSSRSISAKRDQQNYEKKLGEILKIFERKGEEYPDDEEMLKFSERFSNFYSERRGMDSREQLEKLSHLVSDLKSMVHWRKMETSYGKTLGFSNFRSLRGESRKR
jgi:hypothetical protein